MPSDADGVGRAKRTRALYEKLLAAFRERPGNVTYAAGQSGVTRGMAKRAWNSGWKGISWARPLKARVAEEGDEAALEAARKREAREREAESRRAADDAAHAAARADRVKTLAEELQLQTSMRRGVQQAASAVLALSPAVSQLVRVVMRAVFDETFPDGPGGKPHYAPKAAPDVDAKTAMSLIRHWSSIMGKVTLAGEVVVELGREVRGPDEPGAAEAEMSPEEAREELEHLTGIYEGIKAREAEERVEASAPPGTQIQ